VVIGGGVDICVRADRHGGGSEERREEGCETAGDRHYGNRPAQGDGGKCRCDEAHGHPEGTPGQQRHPEGGQVHGKFRPDQKGRPGRRNLL